MQKQNKAQNIRDVIRYIQHFQNAVIVIYMDDEIFDSPLFGSHIRDISLLHKAGLKIVIVPAARKRIDQILTESNILWQFKDNVRLTSENAISQIKMAAFDVSNVIMTRLASYEITATIGNYVRARAKGVINGTDFGTAGEIDKLNVDAIKKTLENGFVPIFPCIGWSQTGKPYNIFSVSLAENIASALKADKLFFLTSGTKITSKNFTIPCEVGLSDEEKVPAMNISELDLFLEKNKDCTDKKTLFLLKTAKNACKNGVLRCHIVDADEDGAIVSEIFSELGDGTMIYSNDYGKIRAMTNEDIAAVLSLMKPFVEKGILLQRSENQIAENLSDFIVFEIDGGIRGTSALHFYDDGQAEIAAVTVDETYSNLGIGPKMMEHLINRAKKQNCKSIFILTTQTGDWFEKLGFQKDAEATMPLERKKIWSPKRNSKLFRMKV